MKTQIRIATILVATLAWTGICRAAAMEALLTDSLQVRSATNDPFFDKQLDLVGVNFYYDGAGGSSGGDVGGGTVSGIGFDDAELSGATSSDPPSTTVFNLSANGPGPVMTIAFPFTSDNTERVQSLNAVGPDGANLETVANEIFYLSNGGNHPSATMTFTNLGINGGTPLFVQVIGGDSGWNGDLDVTANGSDIGIDWTLAGDTDSSTASLLSFDTVADAGGNLSLSFTGNGGNFAGIAAITISSEFIVPEPGSGMAMLGMLGTGILVLRRRRTNG